jgi:hypothetical protein
MRQGVGTQLREFRGTQRSPFPGKKIKVSGSAAK